MTIKKRVNILKKRKDNYINELNNDLTDFQRGFLVSRINLLNDEINYLQDLWLEGKKYAK